MGRHDPIPQDEVEHVTQPHPPQPVPQPQPQPQIQPLQPQPADSEGTLPPTQSPVLLAPSHNDGDLSTPEGQELLLGLLNVAIADEGDQQQRPSEGHSHSRRRTNIASPAIMAPVYHRARPRQRPLDQISTGPREDSLPRPPVGSSSSNKGGSRKMGRRAGQRYQNQLFLRSLAHRLHTNQVHDNNDDDDRDDGEAISFSRTPLPTNTSAFCELFEDMDKLELWQQFNQLSSVKQQRVLGKLDQQKQRQKRAQHPDDNCYFRVDKSIRTMFKRRGAAIIGTVEALETTIMNKLSSIWSDPTRDVTSESVQLEENDSFYRMLIYAVVQYHGMNSLTDKSRGVSTIHITPMGLPRSGLFLHEYLAQQLTV